MLAKKLVLLAGTATALTAASASFAAGYYDSYGRYYYYPERVVVERYPSYYTAPAPVYEVPAYPYSPSYSYSYAPPSYSYAPAPSYYYGPSGTATGAVAGALVGGAIADRNHRAEGAVAGAVIGGLLGSQSDYRYSY